MSQKITSKNLSYDDTLPPFLARLRGQHAASAGEPDPILASRRRAAKPRSASEEAEDAPLVVGEDGQEVVRGVRVGKDGVVTEEGDGGGEEDEEEVVAGGGGQKEVEAKERETVASIGASKKRKVGKVVGVGSEGEDGAAAKEEGLEARKSTENSEAKKNGKTKESATGKKKAKKIKLSFGDDDGA
ncbi:unnamed protein product [Discula destructiva]